jgi:hypothetical protein
MTITIIIIIIITINQSRGVRFSQGKDINSCSKSTLTHIRHTETFNSVTDKCAVVHLIQCKVIWNKLDVR